MEASTFSCAVAVDNNRPGGRAVCYIFIRCPFFSVQNKVFQALFLVAMSRVRQAMSLVRRVDMVPVRVRQVGMVLVLVQVQDRRGSPDTLGKVLPVEDNIRGRCWGTARPYRCKHKGYDSRTLLPVFHGRQGSSPFAWSPR